MSEPHLERADQILFRRRRVAGSDNDAKTERRFPNYQ